MSLPRTGADKKKKPFHAPSGNLQLLYIIGNQMETHH